MSAMMDKKKIVTTFRPTSACYINNRMTRARSEAKNQSKRKKENAFRNNKYTYYYL